MPTYENLPAPSAYFKAKLYEKLVEVLRLAGKARRTVYGYVRSVRKLAEFHQKSPDEIKDQDVRQYLLHLIVELEVATGTQTVILGGLKFFYRITLPRHWDVFNQTKLNYTNTLPEVITYQQVLQMVCPAHPAARFSESPLLRLHEPQQQAATTCHSASN